VTRLIHKNIMFLIVCLILFLNLTKISCQLVFTSLTMPGKDNSPSYSSHSPNSQQHLGPFNNHFYYQYPYYHLAFNESDSIPDEQRLMAQLLRNYDPSARPVYNASNTVSVAFGIALTQLSDMVCVLHLNNKFISRPISWNSRQKFVLISL